MESLSDTKWDVVISGTGLQNSLLALALSRSDKKILHIDQNDYYGAAEAAFSLQEVEEWVEKVRNLGNWWIYENGSLKRLPNGREDIFQDRSIDNRAKRSLMKFLKFVVDYKNQAETWEPHADRNLEWFLSTQFQFPPQLQGVITALTLSLDPPNHVTVQWALPRIARHLTSIGVFGPGFGAVFPKWGGGAEIAQVACRAGAVGGGVYVLGTGARDTIPAEPRPEDEATLSVYLTNGECVRTKHFVSSSDSGTTGESASKMIAILSSPLEQIFTSSIEGAPLSAVSVIVFPSNSLGSENLAQVFPIYIMLHSSETGECPTGQRHESSLDPAFDDRVLHGVRRQWNDIMGNENGESSGTFMQFGERNSMNADDDGDDEY
ncbi:putative rab proteins geranylgeranyltransferase component A [Tricladium varicosporioides]|nr:putative rab proteins geranylgeranyltransferase component A [Hymenoscyphus varicosporioides]